MNQLLLVINWTSIQNALSILATILLIVASINYLCINRRQRKKVKELEVLISKLSSKVN